jgi:hypothetical protein
MAHDETSRPPPARPRRERSTRYPGVSLPESVKLCASLDNLGLDGLSAPAIAAALGYTNIKTNTFSARLSAARQFGLLNLTGDGYALLPLARAILHPVEPAELPRLYRQALLKPPLYAELAERLAGKRLPEPTILGNVLYHNYQIIASAKRAAAEAFLESSRFAGCVGDDQVFHPEGAPGAAPVPASGAEPKAQEGAPAVPQRNAQRNPDRGSGSTQGPPSDVRLDLRLWDADAGKTIRLRAPQTITAASFERFLQAFRLVVRIEE